MTISILQAALSLAQFSPYIAKWFGASQVSDKAQEVLDIAKHITKSTNDEDAFERLQNNANLSMEFHNAMVDANKDIEIAVIHDKKSARSRDIAILNAGRKNKRADIMVLSAAFGLIVCLLSIVLYQKRLPGEAVGIISTIAGIFGSCLKDAYNFEFGSSRGSKEKDYAVASFINKYK